MRRTASAPREAKSAVRLTRSARLRHRALRWGGRFFLVHKPERLVDLMTGLRAARLEPKRIRFVRHRAENAVNLVLIEARLGGGPGLQFEPDLVLYTQTGELSAAGRRIYHLQE